MLVCGCGKNQRRLPSREFLFPRGREHARRMFVMSAVQYQRGRLKAFEPSGPLYPGQGSGGCGRGGKGMEPPHGFQRQGCVFPLMGPGQGWHGRFPVRPGNREGRTAVLRRSFDDGHDTRVLHGSYGRFSGGDDGRFFPQRSLPGYLPDTAGGPGRWGASTAISLGTALVASSLPPSPVSRMMKFTLFFRKWRRATARASSKRWAAVPSLPPAVSGRKFLLPGHPE